MIDAEKRKIKADGEGAKQQAKGLHLIGEAADKSKGKIHDFFAANESGFKSKLPGIISRWYAGSEGRRGSGEKRKDTR